MELRRREMQKLESVLGFSYPDEPKARIPEKKRIEIIHLVMNGMTFCQIARKLEISVPSVSYTYRRFTKYATVQDLKRTGRPYKISAKTVASLTKAIINPNQSVETTLESVNLILPQKGSMSLTRLNGKLLSARVCSIMSSSVRWR